MKTGGDIETGDLWVQCRNGSAFLLIAHDGDKIAGASIWTRQTWQTRRVMRCLALYGTGMTGWLPDMRALAIQLAKDNGCTSLVSDGRRGWQRIFPNAKVLRNLYEEKL
jgi:UDP-N-acetylmuramyl tripeptide synthase